MMATLLRNQRNKNVKLCGKDVPLGSKKRGTARREKQSQRFSYPRGFVIAYRHRKDGAWNKIQNPAIEKNAKKF